MESLNTFHPDLPHVRVKILREPRPHSSHEGIPVFGKQSNASPAT
jgi:hypothetical protein